MRKITVILLSLTAVNFVVAQGDIVELKKELAYARYTLEDTYAYEKTERKFQWDKISGFLNALGMLQKDVTSWGIIQNYRNSNGVSPMARNGKKDAYNSISDAYGVERVQAIPLYYPADLSVVERYGRDGSLIMIIKDSADYIKVRMVVYSGEWMVPRKYVKTVDSIEFKKVICVDRTNQNICTIEKTDSAWMIRSMNPATTGLRRPPYARETPKGIFVLQQKRPKMYYLHDGTSQIAGFAPYANRFCRGAYIHGVPVNSIHGTLVEYSRTLGTTPRSHMCVRNATSHARFIYDWAPIDGTLVYVFE